MLRLLDQNEVSYFFSAKFLDPDFIYGRFDGGQCTWDQSPNVPGEFFRGFVGTSSLRATPGSLPFTNLEDKMVIGFVWDFVMEMFYRYRLGNVDETRRNVLYYSSETLEEKVLDIEELPAKPKEMTRLVLVSDTHDRYIGLTLPRGDIFIHAGDILMMTSKISLSHAKKKLESFNKWLGTLEFKSKIVIAGNHDMIIELLGSQQTKKLLSHATYLQNESICCNSINIFGTPLSQGRSHNSAFQSKQFAEETEHVVENMSQENTRIDILISHGPNFGIANKLRPQVHVWGHLHQYYGVWKPERILKYYTYEATSINAGIMSASYEPSNLPIVVDIFKT